jgi:N-glycosylase/DNA lyase
VSASVLQELLPQLRAAYAERSAALRQRFEEFRRTGGDPAESFYELCYCLCTPATKAVSALKAVEQLRAREFFQRGLPLEELEAILRAPEHYIRFHRRKAQRLWRAWQERGRIVAVLGDSQHLLPQQKRRWLCDNVAGLGMKEASHLLRNTGHRGVVVLDRHVLRWMRRLGMPAPEHPPAGAAYLELEQRFCAVARQMDFAPEELEFLLWSLEVGEVLR